MLSALWRRIDPTLCACLAMSCVLFVKLVISVVTAVTSVLGMPWMVAATVRSLAHLRSLKLYESVSSTEDNSKSGANEAESQDLSQTGAVQEVGVLEQRVSGLAIHVLIGGALLLFRDYLRRIPLCVLTGLFLYLGFSTLPATDMFQRTLLFVTDDRDVPRCTRWSPKSVPLAVTKTFTFIQLALLASMWWIKSTAIGIFFPVLIGLLAPIRIILEKLRVFSSEHLDALDDDLE